MGTDQVRRDRFRLAIRAARSRADMSRAALARMVGVDPTAVTQWEQRGSIPRRRATVEELERVLGCEPGELVAITHPAAGDTTSDLLGALTARVERLEAIVGSHAVDSEPPASRAPRSDRPARSARRD